MKKTHATIVCLAMLLASCSGQGESSSNFTSESVASSTSSSSEFIPEGEMKYEIGISGDEAVLKKAKGNANIAEIPATYEGKPVTRILDGAFKDRSKIQKLKIPENVREIGVDAFNGCTNIDEITLPSSLRKIASRAFNGLRYISHIEIPEGVTFIGDSVFTGCISLESISLPSSLDELGSNLFQSEKLVTTLYEGIEYLGNATNPYLVAYKVNAKNDSPSEAKIHASTKIIGGSLFESESSLVSVSLPEGLEVIGASAFRGCPFTSIAIPSSVKRIDAYAFAECSKMTTCTITGNNLQIIEGEAFSGASALTSINVPSSVTEVGPYAFKKFGDAGALKYNEKDGGCYLGNSENPYHVFVGLNDNSVSSFSLDSSTVVLAGQCFENANNIASLVIPSSLKTIGDSAFFQMGSLTSMVIPETVTNMGNNLFNSCSSITEIQLLNHPTSLGGGFAQNCAKLQSFSIPDSVVSLGMHLFNRDAALTELYIPSSVLEADTGAVSYCENLVVNVVSETVPYLFASNWCSNVKDVHYGVNQ